jgi:hypothetical protein
MTDPDGVAVVLVMTELSELFGGTCQEPFGRLPERSKVTVSTVPTLTQIGLSSVAVLTDRLPEVQFASFGGGVVGGVYPGGRVVTGTFCGAGAPVDPPGVPPEPFGYDATGPLETVSETDDPFANTVPAAGFCDITLPAGLVLATL